MVIWELIVNGSGRRSTWMDFLLENEISTITGSTVKHEYSVDFKNLFRYTNPNTWHKNGDDRWFYYFQLIRPFGYHHCQSICKTPTQVDLSSQLMDSTKAVYFDIPANNLMVFVDHFGYRKDSLYTFGSTQKNPICLGDILWKILMDNLLSSLRYH